LARRGVALADGPDHVHAPSCWPYAALTFLFSGRVEAALDAAAHLEISMVTASPLRAWFGSYVLTVLAAVLDRDRLESRVDAFRTHVDAFGSAALRSLHAHLYAYSLQASGADIGAAVEWYRRSRELAWTNECPLVLGTALTWSLLALGSLPQYEGDALCLEALEYLHDARYWGATWPVLGFCAVHLASTGRTDVAGEVVAYLKHYQPGVLVTVAALLGQTLSNNTPTITSLMGNRRKRHRTPTTWCARSSKSLLGQPAALSKGANGA
jgi:hypothetical protein